MLQIFSSVNDVSVSFSAPLAGEPEDAGLILRTRMCGLKLATFAHRNMHLVWEKVHPLSFHFSFHSVC